MLASAIIGGVASIAGGIFGASAADSRRRDARKERLKLQGKLEELENNRQDIINPYAGVTDLSSMISNPFANLSVATEAARFQAEQSDIALANTLDNLRQTGAGGATALAQAALQSKRGVSANIQQQEAQNQKLQAQGQQRVDLAKAQGQMQVMGLQEQRDVRDLNMLQDQADLLKAQEIYSTQSAMSSLGKGLETLAGGLVPTQLPGVSGSTMDNTNFTRNATEAANQAGLNQIANIQLMNPGQDPSFDFSLSADIYADPQGKNDWQKSGLSNMVKDRERLKQAGESTVELQALIDSTRQKFGI